jgi:hypothetical protein
MCVDESNTKPQQNQQQQQPGRVKFLNDVGCSEKASIIHDDDGDEQITRKVDAINNLTTFTKK